jgi:signal transduction histidine kinase
VNPAPTPEPVASLPVGAAAIGLLLVVGGIVLAVLLLARRQRETRRTPPGPEDLIWLTPLLDGLSQGALVVDPRGHPVAWNARARRDLALTDEVTVLPLSLVTLVGRALDAGAAETTEMALPEMPDRRLRVTASPLGNGLGALVLLQNLSAAARSAESYRRLISAVSHELRTPLTAILGHADILGSCRPEEEALWRRSRDFIAREAQRLARLVEDLLTLSRLDLTPLQRRPVNLRAVAEEAVSALFQAAEARGVQLSLHSPPELPRVLGDRDRLGQVFINLLDNAVKYSPADGQASVHLTPTGGFVEVEVRDGGVGIPPQDLPFVFDPLYRGERGRDTPGTGLGLTIVRTILEQHGATINVQSTPDHGTTFHFRLAGAQSTPPPPPTSQTDDART